MLFFVVVLSLLSVAYSQRDGKPIVHLSPQDLKVVKEAAADCVKETEVKQEVSDNFFKLKIENDAGSKKFLYCLCTRSNYADEAGHLNENVIQLYEGNDRKDDVQKAIDDCNKIMESDNAETMFQTVRCFYKNTPVLVGV